MPVIRICPYCKKGFLKSTYQMLLHVEKCVNFKGPTTVTIQPRNIKEDINKKHKDVILNNNNKYK